MRHPTHTSASLVLQAVAVGLAAAAVILLGAVVAYLVEDADHATAQRDALIEQQRLLVECTTAPLDRLPPVRSAPPDDCFVRQNARSGELVGKPSGPINTVAVISAACGAAHPGDVPATLACTERALREQ